MQLPGVGCRYRCSLLGTGFRCRVPVPGTGCRASPLFLSFCLAPPVLAFSCSTSSCPPSAFIRLLFLSPSVVLPPSLSLPPLCVPLSLRLTHSRSRSSLTVPWRLLLPCPSLPLSLSHTHSHSFPRCFSHRAFQSLTVLFSLSLTPFQFLSLVLPFPPPSLPLYLGSPSALFPSASYPLLRCFTSVSLALSLCLFFSQSHTLTLPRCLILSPSRCFPSLPHTCRSLPPPVLPYVSVSTSAIRSEGPRGGGTELFRQLLSPRAGDSRPPIVGLCSLAPGAWPPCPIHVPGLQSRFSPRTPRLLLPGARIWISIVRGRTRFADLARKRAMPSPPCPGTPCFRAALGCLHPSGRAPRLPPTGRPALVCPTTSLRPPFRGRPSSRPATSPGSPPPASAGCL